MADLTIDEGYAEFLRTRLPLLKRKSLTGWRRPFSSTRRDTKHDTLRYCLSSLPLPRDGLIAEFGVFKGTTIRMIAERYPDRQIFGFDSFVGFPEDGRKDWRLDFSLNGNFPHVPANVCLVPGYFDQTLPSFVEKYSDQRIALLHIDCDIYSSTQTILTLCRDMIQPGCVIVFDELLHYPGFLRNELLAFYEFLLATGRDFEWVAIRHKVMTLPMFLDLRTDPLSFVNGPMRGWRAKGYEQEVAVRIC